MKAKDYGSYDPEVGRAVQGLGKKYALVIGIDRYKDRPLPYAVKDAAEIGRLLEEQYGFEVEKLITPQQTTKDAIEDALGRLLERVSSDDQVVIFFSGHGDPIKQGDRITGGYLVPINGVKGKLSTLLPMDYIQFISRNLKARHVLFIIDACYSGVAGGMTTMGEMGQETAAFVAVKLGKKGRQIMTAGKSGEKAHMDDHLGMSVYSYYLKNGMEGGADHNRDGVITISEMQSYLEQRVSAKTAQKQNPQWRNFVEEGDGEFVFVPQVASAPSVRPSEGDSSSDARVRALEQELKRAQEERMKVEKRARELEARERAAQLARELEEEKRKKEEAERKLKEEEERQSRQLAMARRPKEFTNSLGMKFVYIPPGAFVMGSPANEPGRGGNENQHSVTLTKGFYMGVTEVTQGQWKRVMGHNPSSFGNCGDECPVESVSWDDVQEFIKRLNQQEGGKTYRLPTEAEWEYACRAGATTRYCFGDDEARLGEYAWYDANSGGRTHPVAQKKANAWGLYDMHGNVWEWCEDWYRDYPSSPVIDPLPSSGSRRVIRGGGWFVSARVFRSADRGGGGPGSGGSGFGFRLARTQ